MKLGILTFSYQGFSNFKTEFERTGSYSVNLGDNAQSIAAREILEELGEPPEDMIEIDRDTLPKYDGPPVILIMNGVFYNHSLPVPKNVFPIFVGFNTSAVAIKTHSESLRAHMPIGCRDQHTVDALVEVGIDAYVTGCITLAMKKRPKPEAEKRRLLIVTGAGAKQSPSIRIDQDPTRAFERRGVHPPPTNRVRVSTSSDNAAVDGNARKQDHRQIHRRGRACADTFASRGNTLHGAGCPHRSLP